MALQTTRAAEDQPQILRYLDEVESRPIFVKIANSQESVAFSREVAERIWVA